MLTINSIKNGIVIDHIKAGYGMKIFEYLGLDKADYTALGLIEPNATINIIENEKIKEKINLKLPERVENIIKCKNPRCVTSIENYIPHVFYLVDEEKGEYRCKYCDEIYKVHDK